MSDRSIVARLRLDISDLRANARAGKAELANLATSAQAMSANGGAALKGVGAGLSAGLASVSKHEQSLKTLGSGFTKVGLLAAAGFGIAVKSAADFDQGISNVAATGDDAKKNIGALRAEALQLGAATKFSATEAAAGVENLLKAGVSAQDVLGGGLKGALDLAAAGQISVADASETAATALTQFKLKGADVPHVADLLAAGAGKAQGEVSDMSMALKQSGLVASQFGLSIETTTGTLAAFASAGLIGSDAGTSFKSMLLALANPSKQSRAQMDALGVSAYDAQGKFVGITNLAEQLHTRLSKLPQAQRDAALAQIFGNDAIRAANVLYEQGAGGIEDWISKVNDQGYAAETAATKMDNLKGDLEQLKGALSTALIGGGSGSTSALRDITQMVTRLVDGFNDLDPATQGAAVKVLALVAALGLGGGAAIKLVTSLAAGRTALIELGVAARINAAGGLAAIAPAAIGAGAAIAAVAVATTALDKAGQQRGSASQIQADLISLAKAGDQASSTVRTVQDAFGKTNGWDQFASAIEGTLPPVDNLTMALQVQSKSGAGTLFWLGALREKIIPGQQAFEKAAAGVTAVDTELAKLTTGGHLDQAQAAFKQIAADSGLPIDQVAAQFGTYKGLLEQQANDLTVTGLTAQDYAQWMQGVVPPAIAAAQAQKDLSNSAVDLGAAIASTRAGLVALTQDTKLSADQSSQLAQQVFAEGDAYQNTISAHSSYADAIDQASATMAKNGEYLTKNGKHLSDNTAKGRENVGVLGQLASSGKDYVRSLIAQGASSDEAQRATKGVRDEFIKTAQAAGLGEKAAGKLADQYGLIPDQVSTEFDAFGLAMQQQKVADYQNALAALPDSVRADIEAIYHKDGAAAAIKELDRINGKKSTPRILTKSDAKKVSADAQHVLDAIKDVDPKVKTKKDTTAAKQAQSFLNSIKDVDPKVLTKKDMRAAEAAVAYLRAHDGDRATMTVTTVRETIIRTKHDASHPGQDKAADGGAIYLADGGPGGRIKGNGGPREDNIMGIDRATGAQTSWVSNGEFVTNERAYAANQLGVEMINAGKGQRFNVTPLADGGQPGLFPGLASGGSVADAAIAKAILAMINARTNLVADIKKAQADLAHENAVIAKPKATLDAANSRLTRNKDRQQDLKERVADLKRAADATKGTTKADRDYKRALADLRDGNNAVSRSTTDKKKAQEAYDAVADKSKAAADALKQAQDALAESARGVSDSFRDTYMSKSTDVRDVLQLMKDGAKDLTAFSAQIQQLRSLGLNETTIQQVVDMQQQNPQAGADLASQITAGGKGLVAQLNSANGALQKAADNLGYLAATGVQRKAGGGSISGYGTGTSDDVLIRASAGEFMQPDAAVRHYGLGFMQDVQHLRYQSMPRTPAPVIQPAAVGHGGPRFHVENLYGSSDAAGIARELDRRYRDSMAAVGLTTGVVG